MPGPRMYWTIFKTLSVGAVTVGYTLANDAQRERLARKLHKATLWTGKRFARMTVDPACSLYDAYRQDEDSANMRAWVEYRSRQQNADENDQASAPDAKYRAKKNN